MIQAARQASPTHTPVQLGAGQCLNPVGRGQLCGKGDLRPCPELGSAVCALASEPDHFSPGPAHTPPRSASLPLSSAHEVRQSPVTFAQRKKSIGSGIGTGTVAGSDRLDTAVPSSSTEVHLPLAQRHKSLNRPANFFPFVGLNLGSVPSPLFASRGSANACAQYGECPRCAGKKGDHRRGGRQMTFPRTHGLIITILFLALEELVGLLLACPERKSGRHRLSS